MFWAVSGEYSRLVKLHMEERCDSLLCSCWFSTDCEKGNLYSKHDVWFIFPYFLVVSSIATSRSVIHE
jgi:hypothetical protein